jgi:hypothetical protein
MQPCRVVDGAGMIRERNSLDQVKAEADRVG